jgi:outer membrane protein with beta-barrel domain
MRLAWLVVGLAVLQFAQELHFGLKAGVPLTTYFKTGATGSLHGSSEYSAATRRYTAGASAEWRLTRSFGFEFDILYKRMGYVGIVRTFGSGILTTSAFDAKGNSWDFPVLAKHRFGRSVRPYLVAGGVVRYLGPVRARGESTVDDLIAGTTVRTPIDSTEPSDLRKRLYPGLTAGAGIEFGPRRLRLLPEFRYTLWTANISGPGGVLRFNPNQAEFLLGLLF